MIIDIFKNLKKTLITDIIGLNLNCEDTGAIIDNMEVELYNFQKEAVARETQLINRCNILQKKIDDLKQKAEDEFEPRVYSQAEIDSWNGIGK